jgi:hypothetical protein
VGKSARLRDRRTKRHIKVDDAATVIAAVQSWASRPPLTDPRHEWVRDIARFMFDQWAESPVVLRVDTEFAGALMNSNTDVELGIDVGMASRPVIKRGRIYGWPGGGAVISG